MAINNDLPSIEPISVKTASSSSSTSSPLNQRRPLVQVATNNSATFIQFPTSTTRQASTFVPICRPRTSLSSIRLPLHTLDTQSVSNQSKFSIHAPSSSNISDDHKRSHSHQRINPILSNPLLNHRKEQPKTPPIRPSNEYSRTTRISLSSRPLKSTVNETHISNNRARTAPHLIHQKEPINTNVSDRLTISIDKKPNEQQSQYIDPTKYDYITRWLNEIRSATSSNETVRTKSKRIKRRLTPSSS
ncbi:unnamed protein product [Adineta steineri]|uniref:Uncharacterized protein n=1 Tax=Adineta steineri TaxID=433720 RepID=A0A816CDN5_9BILA|nr:unnamed protein product [Adineta steineri]CAF1620028.1 unnamed protein product [Adineta steineri]